MSTTEKDEFDVPDPRVILAAERTLLAWVRTGLALMGFGFVVARFGLFLRELAVAGERRPGHDHTGLTQWIGVVLILLGVIVNLLAAGQHARFLARFRRGEPYRLSRWSLGIALSVVLAALGVGMAVYLFATSH